MLAINVHSKVEMKQKFTYLLPALASIKVADVRKDDVVDSILTVASG